jgi:excinuclease ABC subunit C
VAFDPETDLDRIATDPGVYLMKDREGVIFYVGKAANLRARLRQYFGATSDRRFFVGLLDRLLADVEVVITLTEKEALILENELIKKHQPRFNVELKDDKSFLHLRIDDRAEWPRIDVVRRPKKDGARYFGPYHSASKIRETLKVVERHFQLRNCDDLTFRNRARPCLQYQIGRCPGPCVLPVDRDEYQRGVQAVALFLQGKRGELVERLRDQMERAAEDLEFERAARYRDQMQAVSGSLEHQQIIQGAAIDQDVFGLYRQGSHVDVAALFVRKGRLQGSRTFSFADQEVPDTEVLGSFLNLYYHAGNDVPDEVVLPLVLESADALTERLAELAGRRSCCAPRAAAPRVGSSRWPRRTPNRPSFRRVAPRPCRTARSSSSSTACGSPISRSASSVTTSRSSRGRPRWPRASSSRAGCPNAPTTGTTRSATSRARTTSP